MGYGVPTDVYAADGQEHTVTGFYVTNNLWAYQSIMEGDYSSTPFGGTTGDDPDWFKLTATGKNASGQTIGTLDFYLADYRFANNEEDYVVDTWEWFDLSPLGAVHTISFELSSTKNNDYGMLTPAYFCIDDFNGIAPDDALEESDIVTIPVYPNPAHAIIFVGANNDSPVQHIELYDITGRKVLTSTDTEINVSELPKGVYFVTVFIENQKIVEKIIVK